jgi:hypothetical protein
MNSKTESKCQKRGYPWLILILIVIFVSCNKYPGKISQVMEEAGSNRAELEKVLSHYQKNGEKEKYRAALFLIGNMEDKAGNYYPNGAAFFELLKGLDSLKARKAHQDRVDAYIREQRSQLARERKIPVPTRVSRDIHVIKAAFLIQHIDLAFRVWKNKPWAAHLSFEQFKEWVLPYRIYDEPLQNWRAFFIEELDWLEDSLDKPGDPREVCLLLNRVIAREFQFSHDLGFLPQLGPLDTWKHMSGTCYHRYYIFAMAARAIGLPLAIDFTLQYSEYPGSHSWTVLLDKDGTIKPFNGGENEIKFFEPAACPIGSGKVTAIFRNTFGKNHESLSEQLAINQVPPSFRNSYMKRVTHEYPGMDKADIRFSLDGPLHEYAYLLSFTYGTGVKAVEYTRIKNYEAHFQHVGRDGIYLLAYYANEGFVPLAAPFILPEDAGSIRYVQANRVQTENLVLYRKFPVKYTTREFAKGMIGAKIQGANHPSFQHAVNLHEIEKPIYSFKEIPVNGGRKFCYYRYLATDTSEVRVADMHFFTSGKNGERRQLQGRVFGHVPGTTGQDHTVFEHAFDNNIRTNFNAPAGSWVAMDLGKATSLTSFRAMPRNNLNIVEPGDIYELLMFDNGWKSLGQKKAGDYHVHFENVPKNALLLLKNRSRGREERIFMYKDGKQDWW